MARKVKIFFDYVCPYCFIGRGILDELRKDHDLEVEWIPYELNPDVGEEGMKLSDHFPDVDLDEMYAGLREKIKPYGLVISGKDHLANTRKAHLATAYAKDEGKADEFHMAVTKAHFTEGRNIGTEQVLKEIAEQVGLDAEKMLKAVNNGTYDQWFEESKVASDEYEIDVVPTFIFDDGQRVNGDQPLEAYRKVLS